MKPSTAPAVLAALLATTASARPGAVLGARGSTTTTPSIQWGDCDVPTFGLPLQCGKLQVPLDWLDESPNRTMITLELIKHPAATQPAPRGSILLNFGGPGQDGLGNFPLYFPLQSPIVGDQFDMISWDPRGTRNTIPFFCWSPEADATGALSQLGTDWWNASDTSPGKLWAETTVISDLCYAKHKDTGRFMGMASVARDMMAIVDALGEDGMLRYWGISGGTTLGSTVAAMFPERVDKVILDGVMNVNQYYNSVVESELIDRTDATFFGLLEACLEVGPEKCPLAARGSTVEELIAIWDASVNDLKHNPLPYSEPSLDAGGLIEYGTYMYQVFNNLYRPLDYQNITVAIDAIIRRDPLTFLTIVLGALPAPPAPGQPVDTAPATRAVLGIRCGDKDSGADSLADIVPGVRAAEARSKWFYGFGLGYNALACAQWKFDAKERYTAGFRGIRTRNPVLFVGNSFDPVTPITSAHNMSAGFEGSAVLEINGFGHTSIVRGSESDCAFDAIRAYLADGTLPEQGKVCQTNKKLSEVWGTV